MSKCLSAVIRMGVACSILVMPTFLDAAPVAVYTNFSPGLSYNTGNGNVIGNAFDGNNYAEADSFMLSGKATFTGMRIALGCSFACPDPVTVTLSSNSGGAPGAALETFTIAGTGLGAFGTNNAPLTLTSLLDPTLLGGTEYWVTVSSDLNDSVEWNLNSAGDVSSQAISTDGGVTWFAPSGQTPGALEIDAVVPEPATVGLILSAGLLFGLIRKRNTD